MSSYFSSRTFILSTHWYLHIPMSIYNLLSFEFTVPGVGASDHSSERPSVVGVSCGFEGRLAVRAPSPQDGWHVHSSQELRLRDVGPEPVFGYLGVPYIDFTAEPPEFPLGCVFQLELLAGGRQGGAQAGRVIRYAVGAAGRIEE